MAHRLHLRRLKPARTLGEQDGGKAVKASNSPIAMIEAAYDFQATPERWLSNLLEAGGDLLDRGQGCAAEILAGLSSEGEPLVSELHVQNGANDLVSRLARAAREIEPHFTKTNAPRRGPFVHTLAEARGSHPEVHDAVTKHVGCRDMLAMWAINQGTHGVGIHIPSSSLIELDRRARKRLKMLSTHISTAHRLRRRLGHGSSGVPLTRLPLEEGAILDPKRLSVIEASGAIKGTGALEAIRSAAIRTDRARRCRDDGESGRAFELWEEVLKGRWSVIDWFDTDGRRFVLALPNAGHVRDPRGLTEREYEVATQVSTGDSCKLVAYRLGISRSRVSALLHGAMRKLGVKTREQLVIKMRGFLAETAPKM
jgi:DNA-binding CsgD family transcriptional regulator